MRRSGPPGSRRASGPTTTSASSARFIPTTFAFAASSRGEAGGHGGLGHADSECQPEVAPGRTEPDKPTGPARTATASEPRRTRMTMTKTRAVGRDWRWDSSRVVDAGGWRRRRSCGAAAAFALQPNDHICIIGNTLAERMQYDGWLETMLQARFRSTSWSSATSDSAATRSHPPAIEELRHAGRVAERHGAADRRLRGQPLRRHQHQGRRRLRVLRLQRVVRRPGRARRRSRSNWATGSRTRWRRNTTASSAPRVVLFSPIAHEDLGNPDLPDGKREQRAAGALHQGDGRSGAHGATSRSSISSRRATKLYADIKAPLTIQGVHLNSRRQPAGRAGHRPRALRRLAETSGGVC